MINRKRTQIIVDDLDWQQLKRIDEKRDKMALISDSNMALRRAKKEAYFQVPKNMEMISKIMHMFKLKFLYFLSVIKVNIFEYLTRV